MSGNLLGELVPCGGGDPLPLYKPLILIGRRSVCDIVLNFPNISSQHCQLELRNGYWHIQDLNSRNGIKVNGERCDSRFLQPGDELSIAKHDFTIQYTATNDAPPPVEEDPLEMGLLEKAGLMRRQAKRPILRPSRPVRTDDSRFSGEENDALRFLEGDD